MDEISDFLLSICSILIAWKSWKKNFNFIINYLNFLQFYYIYIWLTWLKSTQLLTLTSTCNQTYLKLTTSTFSAQPTHIKKFFFEKKKLLILKVYKYISMRYLSNSFRNFFSNYYKGRLYNSQLSRYLPYEIDKWKKMHIKTFYFNYIKLRASLSTNLRYIFKLKVIKKTYIFLLLLVKKLINVNFLAIFCFQIKTIISKSKIFFSSVYTYDYIQYCGIYINGVSVFNPQYYLHP